MKRITACLALICLLTAGAQASINVSLGTNTSAGSPLVVASGGSAGGMTVSISNSTGPSVPSDNMSGWQTTLVIASTGGTGTVGFSSATLPSSYIFSSISSSGLSTSISTSTNPNDTLLAFDFNFPYTGGTPVPSSANLLSLSFSASAAASGSFGVFAVGLPGSEWTDSSSPTPMSQAFSNISGSTQVGAILVQGDGTPPVIPEPFSFLTWSLLGCLGFAGYYIRRHQQIA